MKKIIILLILFLASDIYTQSTDEFSLAFTDTTSTGGDTLSRRVVSGSNDMGDTCQSYQLMYMADDTVSISTGAGYSSVNTYRLLPGTGILDWKCFSAFVPNLYYKTYGSGTPTVYFKIKAWGKQ